MKINNICFVIASNDISGGMNVIFNHAIYLAKNNIKVTLVSKKKLAVFSWHPIFEQAKNLDITWRTIDEGGNFDVAIATFWATYYDLWQINASKYVYFVQSIESRFVPEYDVTQRLYIEATYDLPIGVITEAKWIKEYLEKVRGLKVELAPNGIDKNIYSPHGNLVKPKDPNKIRILVEGPLEASFKNVPRTIELCREIKNAEIWLLTSSECKSYDGVDQIFSRVPVQKTAEIYRSCDVIVKLSYVEGMFGPPLEMFACGGTCIVYDVTGHNEYIIHGYNGLVAKTDDEKQVIEYLNELKNQKFQLMLKENAVKTAEKWIDWESSSKLFLSGLNNAAENSEVNQNLLKIYSVRIQSFLNLISFSAAPSLSAPSLSATICWDQNIPNIHWAYRMTVIKAKLHKYPKLIKIIGCIYRLIKKIAKKFL